MNDYRKKTLDELEYIVRDAGEAARSMRDLDPKAEAKYLDQVNDASSELYRRRIAKARKIVSRACSEQPAPGLKIMVFQTYTGRWGYCPADFYLKLYPHFDDSAPYLSVETALGAVKGDLTIPAGARIEVVYHPEFSEAANA